MKSQNITVENKSNLKNISKIKDKVSHEINFEEFDQLLEFSDSNTKAELNIGKEPTSLSKKNTYVKQDIKNDTEIIVKEKVQTKTNYKENIDFSMFDELIKDFEKVPSVISFEKENKKRKTIKISTRAALKFLKKEIRYYETKIETIYKLDNLEKEENKLFDIKKRIDNLKNNFANIKESDNKDYKTNELVKFKNEIIDIQTLLNTENILNINKINNNLQEVETIIKNLEQKLKTKLYFCMIKRMMYNLFKMIVGMYTIESYKKDYIKLNIGSFLVINSIIGIKEAITLDFGKKRYYKYSDYTDTILNEEETMKLTINLLDKSIINIDELKHDFKLKFYDYKEYIDDYEEIYFKINKLKKLIEYKREQLIDNN